MSTTGSEQPARQHAHEQYLLRIRVQWLMAGRLAVVSILLGAMLAAGLGEVQGHDTFTPRFLQFLIAGTYAASAVFGAALMRGTPVRLVAVGQLAWDLLLVTGLVYVSGGAASIFSFLYGITVLAAALVTGATATVRVAVAALLLYTIAGIGLANGWIPHPSDQRSAHYMVGASELGFALLSNIVGLVVASVLANRLAVRLQTTGGELRRAERSAAALARLNDDIVRSISAGLITTDRDLRIRTINPAGASMFDAQPEELVSRPLDDLLSADQSPSGLDRARRAEGEGIRPDGSRFPLGFTVAPLVSAEGDVLGSLVVFQDLTEVVQLRETADRAERLAALGRLAAGLAHEIRNPLSSISGSVQLVREAEGLADEDRRLLGIVLSEVERLEELVTAMLEVGRPSQPRPVTTDLRSIIDEVVAMARRSPSASSEVSVRFEVPEDGLEAWVDAAQIRQVLWNLIKNAIQASGPGGMVRVTARREANEAIVEVHDSGSGVADDQPERLFEMFYSRRQHGVGLGLALVKQIVDLHGGRVEVESTPGRGATFRVRFPASPRALPYGEPLTADRAAD